MENDKDLKQQINKTIEKIAGYMNLECQVQFRDELDDVKGKTISAAVYMPENARFLIGKNGQNIQAFEHLLRTIFVKNESDYKNIVVDVNDYKKSRASQLISVAKDAVTRVRGTQKAEVLMPMSAYERRVVHMELASYPDIITESTGDEPQRRIIVKPYP